MFTTSGRLCRFDCIEITKAHYAGDIQICRAVETDSDLDSICLCINVASTAGFYSPARHVAVSPLIGQFTWGCPQSRCYHTESPHAAPVLRQPGNTMHRNVCRVQWNVACCHCLTQFKGRGETIKS